MNTKKPETIDKYISWLEEHHDTKISRQVENYYLAVAEKIKWSFESSPYWTLLLKNLQEFDDEYHLETGYPLFAPRVEPTLSTKPFNSFFDKTFRKNVIHNKNWPEAPNGGWVLPDNWYTRISDIVRTSLIVKYLDGVEFTVSKMNWLCEQCNLSKPEHIFEAREEGYYAAHVYIKEIFEVPADDWDTKKINVKIEIQIRTQVQDVIRRLLHNYYEKRRQNIDKQDVNWQWNYRSDDFSANYLGHILHYLEGLIIEIRDKQREDVSE